MNAKNPDDQSAAELREDHSPVSERFAAAELGAALVVFDNDDSTRWVLSDTARSLNDMR